METLFGKMRSLDAYPKINEDFYSRTLSGGVITLVSSIFMLLLFISELRLYFHTATETNLVVDTSRGERLRINFDVTFPAFPCSILSLDAMDMGGEQHLDVRHDIIKRRIDAHGNIIETRADTIGAQKIEQPLQRHGGRLDHNETYCGSCYGAEVADEDCCNNCEEVREAYRKKGWALSNPDSIDQCKREGFLQRIKEEEGEGCNLYGFLDVNRVADKSQGQQISLWRLLPWCRESSGWFSVTEHVKGAELGRLQALPGVFFFYDLSPIKVTFTETHVSFLHFLTNVCAIVGGVFTVSGIIDSFVYHSQKAIKRKMEIGKFS
ncbi:uncharacterized protein [Primulina eburnea]|uniref:uncharacterized protein isoform X3 n=1 Tax=Primulina eburnea TaxID=1245227 RepID=UPI003C6C4EDA